MENFEWRSMLFIKIKQITNTKIIEWSDNTYSLCIGDQMFDIIISK